MRQQLEQRLKELKAEFETGRKMLAELEVKQTNLRNTVLRISGAIQVLEELLVGPAPAVENEEHLSETYQNSCTSLQDDGKEASREL